MTRTRRRAPREVFLSHSTRDRPFATRLSEVLAKHGVPVWYSTTEIIGAQQWQSEIGKALKRCDWFLVVLSPASVRATWVARETSYSLIHPKYDGRIVPLMFRTCDPDRLSWVLSAMQYVDFRKSFAAGCRDLLRTWGKGYRP